MERHIGEVLLLASIFLTFNYLTVSAHELCIWESVTAFCAADEVVFIETANYGRFRNSRCYSFKENETSCSADIRLEMQMNYGAPQNMSYPLAEEFFTTRSPECLQGRMPSLEVSYRCVKSIGSEVCFHETFSAACSPGTVIYIQSAFYGRMHSSRCIYFDNRDLHCYADVQLYFESLCNGRAECSIRASNNTLRNANKCRTNLKPYLEVFYKCAPDDQSLIKKILITVPSATGGLIIFLITVAVCTYKHRKRKSSSSYVNADAIKSMKCTRYGEITPPVVPNPRPTTSPLVEQRPEPDPPTINEDNRLPPEPSIYTKLIPQGLRGEQPTGGATISVPLDLRNFKVTLNITVEKETELQYFL